MSILLLQKMSCQGIKEQLAWKGAAMFTVADLVQMGAFLVALLALIYQIGNQRSEANQHDERFVTKLKVFFLCQGQDLTEQEIIEHFQKMNPAVNIDENEIRKSIYEMLKDGTLRY